jgi:hypothetical protein
MNDERSGRLTSTWTIPAYAQAMLWLDTEAGAAQTEGIHGTFQLGAPAEMVVVRWGGADGPALAQLRWRADSLEWDGAVRIGGFVDTLHLTGEPYPVGLLSVGGQPLRYGAAPYPSADERSRVPYTPPLFSDGLAEEVEEGMTTWLAPDDSPLLAMAQDALVSKLRVYCFGRLAEEDGGWHEHFALPILLEAMTLFG